MSINMIVFIFGKLKRLCFCPALLSSLVVMSSFLPNVRAEQGFSSNYQSPSESVSSSGPSLLRDLMPKFTPDFWKGFKQPTFLPAGTVLTGVLQDKLSSKNSRVGDLFAIVLPDGYREAGNQLLPNGAKVVGAVANVLPASQMRNGNPGQIDITLQTLVLPDGRTTPIYGFIERNPNLAPNQNTSPTRKTLPIRQYLQSLKNSAVNMVNTVSRRSIGMSTYYPGQVGQDFLMEPGEVVPIRLSNAVDIDRLMAAPIPPTAWPQAVIPQGLPQGFQPFNNNYNQGMAPTQPSFVPGLFNYGSQPPNPGTVPSF